MTMLLVTKVMTSIFFGAAHDGHVDTVIIARGQNDVAAGGDELQVLGGHASHIRPVVPAVSASQDRASLAHSDQNGRADEDDLLESLVPGRNARRDGPVVAPIRGARDVE